MIAKHACESAALPIKIIVPHRGTHGPDRISRQPLAIGDALDGRSLSSESALTSRNNEIPRAYLLT